MSGKEIIEIPVRYKDEIMGILEGFGFKIRNYEEKDDNYTATYIYEVIDGWKDDIEVYCYGDYIIECWIYDYRYVDESNLIKIMEKEDLNHLINELRNRLKHK